MSDRILATAGTFQINSPGDSLRVGAAKTKTAGIRYTQPTSGTIESFGWQSSAYNPIVNVSGTILFDISSVAFF